MMSGRKPGSWIQISGFVLLLLLVLPIAADGQIRKIISPGDYFPEFNFSSKISGADAAYLGISEKLKGRESFRADDVWGDLLVLEIFNRYCFSGQQQAPLLNKAFEMIVTDPKLSRKVRFLGVGTGNTSKAVRDFKKEFLVPFPLVPDPGFEIMTTLGNPGGTPFTLILRRTTGGMMVVKAHFGMIDSPEEFVEELKEVLTEDFEKIIAAQQPVELAPWIAKDMKPPLSDTEIMDRVQESMRRAGYGSVGLYAVKMRSGEKIYIGEGKRGKVFSRMVSRLPVCDVSHPIHFVVTFNTRGQVIDFDAVFVTKYWNKSWTDKEVASMRKKLRGISVLESRVFNPDVDAISTATMSSSIIFDSVIKTEKIFEILKTQGHL
jgi:hypothetical protein